MIPNLRPTIGTIFTVKDNDSATTWGQRPGEIIPLLALVARLADRLSLHALIRSFNAGKIELVGALNSITNTRFVRFQSICGSCHYTVQSVFTSD